MKKKLLVLFAALALAAFGLAACGDDDDDDAATETTTEEPTDTGTEDEGAAGGGSTVSFTANPDGELAFEEDSAEATAGSVTVELTNDSGIPHDVKIEGPDGDVGGTEQITEGMTSADVQLDAGEYTFYCSVPGHREAGMEGPLTVE